MNEKVEMVVWTQQRIFQWIIHPFDGTSSSPSSSSSSSSIVVNNSTIDSSSSSSSNFILPCILATLSTVVVLVLLHIYNKRRRMYRLLVNAGIPTIFWYPRIWKMNNTTSTDTVTNKYPNKCKMSFKYNNNNNNSNNQDDDTNSYDNNNNNESIVQLSNMYQHLLSSTNITNVLPRMMRLTTTTTVNNYSTNHNNNYKNNISNTMNEYNMYGTIYGISTSVIHIAHPIPITSILCGSSCSSTSNINSSNNSNHNNNNNHFIKPVTKKFPAYQHFRTNFVGNGVFTVDDNDTTTTTTTDDTSRIGRDSTPFTTNTNVWKQKRIAILHTIMKHANFISNIEEEINNSTIHHFINTIHQSTNYNHQQHSHANDNTKVTATTIDDDNDTIYYYKNVNIVPILQRTTIGFIYQYLTHDRITFGATTTTTSCSSDNNNNNNNNIDSLSQAPQKYVCHSNKIDDNNDSNCKHRQTSTTAGTNKTKKKMNESFIQQYLQSITNIRMILLAQSRSIYFLLLPSRIYRSISSLYKIEKDCIMPSIQQMAEMACYNALPNSSIYQLIQNYPLIYGNNNNNDTKRNDKINECNNNKGPYSKNIIDEVITLLFAGQDTTAATLSWTIHLLSIYPYMQDRLYHDIISTLQNEAVVPNDGNSNTDEIEKNMKNVYITKKLVGKMNYLDAVIKESMRLYPVAPFIVRNIGNTLHLPASSDYKKSASSLLHLPDNTLACIWIYSLHRHPKYWSKPNDYIPERWLDGVATATTTKKDTGITTPGAYIPYATGPRNCLGQPIANIVLRILLVRLILQYEFIDERATKILSQESHQQRQQQQQQRNNKEQPQQHISPEIQHQLDMLRKEMQAGFTILPMGGVTLSIRPR